MIFVCAPLILGLVATTAPTTATAPDLITMGRGYAQRGQDAKAVPLFEQAVAKDPKNGEAHYLLGVSYSRMEKPEVAESHLEKAIALDPTNYPAYLLLGMSKDLRSDPAGALAVYLRAIEVDKDRPEAYREAGSSELLLGKSDAAAVHLERAYTLSNHDTDVAADYGYALVRSQKCPAAEKVLTEAAGNDPRNADLQSALADSLACQGKVDPAIQGYRKATHLDAKNGQAWFHLGLLLTKKGDPAAAKEALLQARLLRPHDAEVAAALNQMGAGGEAAPAATLAPSGPVKPRK